jgi:hypothetical protein
MMSKGSPIDKAAEKILGPAAFARPNFAACPGGLAARLSVQPAPSRPLPPGTLQNQGTKGSLVHRPSWAPRLQTPSTALQRPQAHSTADVIFLRPFMPCKAFQGHSRAFSSAGPPRLLFLDCRAPALPPFGNGHSSRDDSSMPRG